VSNIVYAWNYLCCYVVIDIIVRLYCSIDELLFFFSLFRCFIWDGKCESVNGNLKKKLILFSFMFMLICLFSQIDFYSRNIVMYLI
jgi:hypothetical protein